MSLDNITHVRCFSLAVLALTSVCAQYTTLLIAHTDPKPSKQAQWDEGEIEALVEYLYTYHSEAGDSGFKSSTFNNAAAHIAPLLVSGQVKEGKHCHTKWVAVCLSIRILTVMINTYVAEEDIYYY